MFFVFASLMFRFSNSAMRFFTDDTGNSSTSRSICSALSAIIELGFGGDNFQCNMSFCTDLDFLCAHTRDAEEVLIALRGKARSALCLVFVLINYAKQIQYDYSILK